MPEIQNVYEKVLMDRATPTGSSFWRGNWNGGYRYDPKPVVIMTKEERQSAVVTVGNQEVFLRDIPKDFADQSTAALKKAGFANPSVQQIAQQWLEFNNKK